MRTAWSSVPSYLPAVLRPFANPLRPSPVYRRRCVDCNPSYGPSALPLDGGEKRPARSSRFGKEEIPLDSERNGSSAAGAVSLSGTSRGASFFVQDRYSCRRSKSTSSHLRLCRSLNWIPLWSTAADEIETGDQSPWAGRSPRNLRGSVPCGCFRSSA